MAKSTVKKKKKIKKAITSGTVHIKSTFNNTIVTISDDKGNVISWSSSGACGFKGSRKSTPYAAQIATETAIEKAKAFGFSDADVFVKGIGSGRETAVRSLQSLGIYVKSIKDVTPAPHNGCRAKKPRRL